MWERERKRKNRRERLSKTTAKGLVILIFIILIVQILYFIWGEFFRDRRVMEETWFEEVISEVPKPSNLPESPQYFDFDPNTVTKEELEVLGLSSRQAQVVINYREKGGKFRKPADFSKIYVISDSLYRLLEPYIRIEQQAEQQPVQVTNPEIKQHASNNSASDYKKNKISQPSEKEEKTPPLDNRIELNSADSLQLLTLYGIGPYYASKILQYRDKLGSFHSIEQLLEIKGIDPERFEGFHKRIRIDSTTILPLDLYGMSPEELSAHPYIGSYTARGIIRLREITPKEEFRPEMLLENRILPEERYNKLSRYLKIIPDGTE